MQIPPCRGDAAVPQGGLNQMHCGTPVERVRGVRGAATLVALNKNNGEVIWKASVPEGDGANYSSVIVADRGGSRQYIQYLADGVVGIQASDGKYLWRENSSADSNRVNCSSPVYHDGGICAVHMWAPIEKHNPLSLQP